MKVMSFPSKFGPCWSYLHRSYLMLCLRQDDLHRSCTFKLLGTAESADSGSTLVKQHFSRSPVQHFSQTLVKHMPNFKNASNPFNYSWALGICLAESVLESIFYPCSVSCTSYLFISELNSRYYFWSVNGLSAGWLRDQLLCHVIPKQGQSSETSELTTVLFKWERTECSWWGVPWCWYSFSTQQYSPVFPQAFSGGR